MAARGHVLAPAAWRRWIAHAQRANVYSTHYLPKYAKVYYPTPLERGG
jgi:hypothetical protein